MGPSQADLERGSKNNVVELCVLIGKDVGATWAEEEGKLHNKCIQSKAVCVCVYTYIKLYHVICSKLKDVG